LPRAPSDSQTNLWNAASQNNYDSVERICSSQTLDVNWSNVREDGSTALHVACAKDHLYVVEKLLFHPLINVNQRNSRGQTPFFVACLSRREEIVRRLLRDPRVNVNGADYRGSTPLWIAARDGFLNLVKWMLASKRTFDLRKKGGNSSNLNLLLTPFEIAEKQHHDEIVTLLRSFEENPARQIRELRTEFRLQGN
jgi:ankyrin repeat protein